MSLSGLCLLSGLRGLALGGGLGGRGSRGGGRGGLGGGSRSRGGCGGLVAQCLRVGTRAGVAMDRVCWGAAGGPGGWAAPTQQCGSDVRARLRALMGAGALARGQATPCARGGKAGARVRRSPARDPPCSRWP